LVVLGAALLFSGACGGGKPAEETVQKDTEPVVTAEPEQVSVEGLLGKIDDSVVEDLFRRNQDRILACYQNEALEVLEEIEGQLEAYIEVDRQGQVTATYFTSGDLGSNAAQSCLLNAIQRMSFPAPIGGSRAEMHYDFPFEEPYDHPAPFDWSGEAIDAVVAGHQAEVDQCLNGQTDVALTVYVGRKGRVVAAGGTGRTADGYHAAECLSQAAMSWTFEDPGKTRPAKATVRF